ncbi:M23 family metallopeptidase [Streptomyces sp. NPDC014894]|uniref:M23 family metallopeptidase n=1 Tax=unclassified Streptomyces TaxID=2593676 RepID=UPI0036F7350F
MASNTPAPESPFRTGVFSEDGAERSVGEWNPTAETVRPVRGRHRHRVIKQRGGFARSSTVLGVGVIAAVGAGGIATAQNKPAVSISLPDVESLPGIGSFMSEDAAEPDTADTADASGYETMGGIGEEVGAQQSTTTAAEALRSRILEQAEEQQAGAEAMAQAAAEKAAAEKAAKAAEKAEKEAQERAKEKAEAKKAAEKAEKEAQQRAEEKAEREAAAKAEAERAAKAAGNFSLPTSSYRITATYGQSGSMWSSGQHTGLDFAAPAGTPAKAVTTGTITSAGWSGSYGYRVVLELSDGTEVWYAHLSSMTVSPGQKVAPGETIGRVGSTGNSSAPHLHLEVKTPGGSGIDPLSWLRGNGLTV